MKFCDCGNILTPVITAGDAYHECSVCKKKHAFEVGDTLIRPPAIKPSGFDKIRHMRNFMHKNIFETVNDRPCPMCNYRFAKVMIDAETWYGCMNLECGHIYQ